MLQKPPHGSPCNGCGMCCADQRCPLGQVVFGPGGRCPALQMQMPGFVCGLLVDPGKYAPDVVARHGEAEAKNAGAYLIGAGYGCDSQLEGEPYNFRWAAWAKAQVNAGDVMSAFAIWRGAE